MTYQKANLPIPRRDLFLDIAKGEVNGYVSNTKFGRNEEVGTSWENINDLGGTYTYSTSGATHYISSSSGSDTDQTVTIVGLDSNKDEITRTVSLAGQTKTEITGGTFFRVYRTYISAGSDAVGDIYIYENDTVTAGVPDTSTLIRAKILIGNGQSQMAQITVPSGMSMIVTDFLMTSGKDNNMRFAARIRPSDGSGPWRTILDHDVYRESLMMSVNVPWIIPSEYDVEVRAKGTTSTSEVACLWSYICEETS